MAKENQCGIEADIHEIKADMKEALHISRRCIIALEGPTDAPGTGLLQTVAVMDTRLQTLENGQRATGVIRGRAVAAIVAGGVIAIGSMLLAPFVRSLGQ